MYRSASKRETTRFAVVPILGFLLFTASACDIDETKNMHNAGLAAKPKHALHIETYNDPSQSAPPVYVQIKVCQTEDVAEVHEAVQCSVDPEFALVGGGAKAQADPEFAHAFVKLTPFLTESRPLNGKTWQASSSDHLLSSPHRLTVYAIGMRLEGVNTQYLREAIHWEEIEFEQDSSTIEADEGWSVLGVGAKTTKLEGVDDANRFLSGIYPTDENLWQVASRDHLLPASGITSAWRLQIENRIFEGFGALEFKTVAGPIEQVEYGYATSSVAVPEGWALIGMGGVTVSDPQGAGRMLVSIAPSSDAISVEATSRNLIDIGGGTTQAFAVVARKVEGSHGICNPRNSNTLQPYMDSCVAKICAADKRPECCTNAWDAQCTEMVEDVCGRSCEKFTCHPMRFEEEKWHLPGTDTPVKSNCYEYALNRYPDGSPSQPGGTLNLSESDNPKRYHELAMGEGFIPTTHEEECTDGRTKIFITWQGNASYLHVMRQDENKIWSDKFASSGYAKIPSPEAKHPFENNTELYKAGYYCACNQPLPDFDAQTAQEIDVTANQYNPSPGLTIQIKTCATTVKSDKQLVDCSVDEDFVLVGGGIKAEAGIPGARGALINENRPINKQTWRGTTSSDYWQHLSVYAIGLKIDGTHPQDLKDAINIKSASVSTNLYRDSLQLEADDDCMALSGGGKVSFLTTTPFMYSSLVESRHTNDNGWQISSLLPITSTNRQLHISLLQIKKKIFEGFGALEIKKVEGAINSEICNPTYTSAVAESGWGLIGIGGHSLFLYLSQPDTKFQKNITALYPNEQGDGAIVLAQKQTGIQCGSVSYTQPQHESLTVAYVTEARKLPGSHGLCETGDALSRQLDPCIGSVCDIVSQCCTTAWSEICVQVTNAICDRSCF